MWLQYPERKSRLHGVREVFWQGVWVRFNPVGEKGGWLGRTLDTPGSILTGYSHLTTLRTPGRRRRNFRSSFFSRGNGDAHWKSAKALRRNKLVK